LSDVGSALRLLDPYEGDLYARVLRPVDVAGGNADVAWCYVLKSPELLVGGTSIRSGSWRHRATLEKRIA